MLTCMSYVNFSLTQVQSAGAPTRPPVQNTTSVGFSREGGRVEQVTYSYQPSAARPAEQRIRLTEQVLEAAAGVRDAIVGGAAVQNMTLHLGDGGQPNLVTWTHSSGSQGSGTQGSLPVIIERLLDAGLALRQAAKLASIA